MGNFEFLESNWSELAKLGDLAEKYLYSDSNTCFLKIGLLSEHIVEYMLHMMEFPNLKMITRMLIELSY